MSAPGTEDAGEHRVTVVLLHGRDQGPEAMPALAHRIGHTGIDYVFPRAPGWSWYPHAFMAPLADNEPALSAAVATCEAVVSGLIAAGQSPARIVVGGFSQGACLAAQFLVIHPRRYGAAFILTGGLVGPRGAVWPLRPGLAGLPVFVTTAEDDPFVPPARARETHEWLVQSGARADLKIFATRGHVVLDEEVARVRGLIDGARARSIASPRRLA